MKYEIVGSQTFLCLRLYAFLLWTNLTLGVPSYAFGQVLTAVNTAVKVRLIHSEHFFLSPKARKKPGPQKNRQKKYVQSNIFVFFLWTNLRLTGFEPMSPVSAPFRHFSPFSSWLASASLHLKKRKLLKNCLLSGAEQFCLSWFLFRQGKARSEYLTYLQGF